jgi:hypothetical protein
MRMLTAIRNDDSQMSSNALMTCDLSAGIARARRPADRDDQLLALPLSRAADHLAADAEWRLLLVAVAADRKPAMKPPAAAMANAIASGIVGERTRNFNSTLCQLVRMEISTTAAIRCGRSPSAQAFLGRRCWLGHAPPPRWSFARTAAVPEMGSHRSLSRPGRPTRTLVRRFGSSTASKDPPSTHRGVVARRFGFRSQRSPYRSFRDGWCAISHRRMNRHGRGFTHPERCQILDTAADLRQIPRATRAGRHSHSPGQPRHWDFRHWPEPHS